MSYDQSLADAEREIRRLRDRVSLLRHGILRFNSRRANPDQYMRDLIARDDALASQAKDPT